MDALAKRLLRISQEVVSLTLQSLPPDLAQLASGLTVLHQPSPSDELVEEGWDPDLLGLFVGSPTGTDPGLDCVLPPQIFIFYENLWGFSEEDEAQYREEIKITFLHELGHYLGLDEVDLEERGLL